MKNIYKIGLVALLLVVLGGYIVYTRFSGNPAPVPVVTDTGGNSDNSGQPQTQPQPQPQPQPSNGQMYTDGQYTGDAVDAFYGTMQVEAVVSGGKLTDVKFLQYPNSAGHTTEVSNMALPILKSEAIAAQSSNVNVVSGATQTSEGFINSLHTALVQAQSKHLPM